jgi:hypothetical protein
MKIEIREADAEMDTELEKQNDEAKRSWMNAAPPASSHHHWWIAA